MSAQERTIAWLWEAQCLDRIGLFPGQGPSESMFVVLKENKNFKKKKRKKKNKRVLIPGPLRWSWCWPPWRHDSFAFSRGFLWKNWFCFGFLFRVMYSVDTFLQRAILLSFVNWFLLVTYWGGGFSLGRPGRACLKDVVPGRLGGSYYITVLYGKPITNGDSIRTLIAFLNNFSHTNKNNNTADKSAAQRGVPDIVLPIWSTTTTTTTTNQFSLTGSKQPWLK